MKEFNFSQKSLKGKVVVYYIQYVLILFILSSAGLMFVAPYTILATLSVILVVAYLMFSLIYFTKATKEKRSILLNMWKIYFPILTLMAAFLFTTEADLRQFLIDYEKTKLDYQLKTNFQDFNKTFSEYESIIENHLKNNQKQKIIVLTANEPKESIQEENYTVWYGNFTVSIINIVTLFMFLWSLVEFNTFKDKKVKPLNWYQIHNRLNRNKTNVK